MQVYSLCRSQLGLPLPVVRIGFGSRVVLVTSRVHPGESNSSYAVEGFIRELLALGQLDTSRDTLQKVTFLIIPMLNPDGVVLGNFRTGAAGTDLNREFAEDSNYPEVRAIQQLFYQLTKKGLTVCLYLDFHGHSERKNTFFYGPSWPINETEYMVSRLLPKMVARRTTIFRFYACSFRIEACKKATARALFF